MAMVTTSTTAHGSSCRHHIRPCGWCFPREWFHSNAVVKCQLSSLLTSGFVSCPQPLNHEGQEVTDLRAHAQLSLHHTPYVCGEQKRHRLDSHPWNLKQRQFHWILPQGNSTLNWEFSCPTRHTRKLTDLLGTKREESGRFVQFLSWVLGL